MFLSKDILTALALIVFVNTTAVPNLHTSLERRATQSCRATDHCFWAAYGIQIGLPYEGPVDCDDTCNAINNAIAISNWQCVEGTDANIQLRFNAPTYYGGTINDALRSCYPGVNSFNCPDY